MSKIKDEKKEIESVDSTVKESKGQGKSKRKNYPSRDMNKNKKPVKYSISKYKGEEYGNNKSGSVKSEWYSSTGKPTNDPNWYTQIPILTSDVANLWFSRPTGEYYPLDDPSTTVTMDYRKFNPGIMVFETMTAWGGTETASLSSAAINVAAAKLYQFVVHANSRNTTYDEKDLMMILMQADAMIQVITEAKRAYQLIAQSDFTNLFVRRLLNACGWNAEELTKNPLELKEIIDIATDRLNREFIPGIFSIFPCHASMYANVYLDDLSAKSQLYLTKSAGIWIYNDEHGDISYQTTINTGNGTVVWSNSDHTVKHTLNDLRVILDFMWNTMKSSRYNGIMEGDLLKAFGIETMINIPYIEMGAKITPVFDTEFLFKLHNAEVRGNWHDSTAVQFNISNFNGDTESKAICIYRDTDVVDGNIIDLHNLPSDDPTKAPNQVYYDMPANVTKSPENVLLMTCYKSPTASVVEVNDWRLNPEATTTISVYRGGLLPENILSVFISIDPNNPDTIIDVTQMFVVRNHTSPASLAKFMLHVALSLNFNVTPRIPQHTITNVGTSFGYPAIWDSTDVLVIPREKVNKMQYVILNSLWSARVIGNTGD